MSACTVYSILIHIITAQYETFYSFDCASINTNYESNWTISGIDGVSVISTCPAIWDSPCWDVHTNSMAVKTIPTTGYHTISLFVSVAEAIDFGDTCEILYRPSSAFIWAVALSIEFPFLPKQSIEIPFSNDPYQVSNRSTFQLALINNSPNSGTHCYYDDIWLRGIPINESSTDQIPSPTSIPTDNPTISPTTDMPTPSMATTDITRYPTDYPSLHPSSIPSTAPTSFTSIPTTLNPTTNHPATSIPIKTSSTHFHVASTTTSSLVLTSTPQKSTKPNLEQEVMNTTEYITDASNIPNNDSYLILTIILVVIAVFCVSLIGSFVYKKNMNEKIKAEVQTTMVADTTRSNSDINDIDDDDIEELYSDNELIKTATTPDTSDKHIMMETQTEDVMEGGCNESDDEANHTAATSTPNDTATMTIEGQQDDDVIGTV